MMTTNNIRMWNSARFDYREYEENVAEIKIHIEFLENDYLVVQCRSSFDHFLVDIELRMHLLYYHDLDQSNICLYVQNWKYFIRFRLVYLPDFDWSWRSRHDWNGYSRWRPVGTCKWFNCFERFSRRSMSWKPAECGAWFFSIERRNRCIGQSTFSESGLNGPNWLDKIVSPGGPWRISNWLWIHQLRIHTGGPAGP